MDHRKLVVLGTIAWTAGIKIIVPGENQFGVKILRVDVLHLISYRVLAVAAAPGPLAHFGENFLHMGEGGIVSGVAGFKLCLSSRHPFHIGRQVINFLLPCGQIPGWPGIEGKHV